VKEENGKIFRLNYSFGSSICQKNSVCPQALRCFNLVFIFLQM